MVTNMDIGSKWMCQGAKGPHATLADPTWALLGATLARAMSPICGSCSRSILMH
jgi:hypothetical protein